MAHWWSRKIPIIPGAVAACGRITMSGPTSVAGPTSRIFRVIMLFNIPRLSETQDMNDIGGSLYVFTIRRGAPSPKLFPLRLVKHIEYVVPFAVISNFSSYYSSFIYTQQTTRFQVALNDTFKTYMFASICAELLRNSLRIYQSQINTSALTMRAINSTMSTFLSKVAIRKSALTTSIRA
jgi:hypothetical protein